MKNVIFVMMLAMTLVGCDTVSAPPNVDGGTAFEYNRTDFLLGNRLVFNGADPTNVFGIAHFEAGTDLNHIVLNGSTLSSLTQVSSGRDLDMDPCHVNLSLKNEDNTIRHFTYDPAVDGMACQSSPQFTLAGVDVVQDVKYPQRFVLEVSLQSTNGLIVTSYHSVY